MADEDPPGGDSAPNSSEKNRLRFEALDLEATEAIVRMIKIAERLAQEKPEVFFGAAPTELEELVAKAAKAAGLPSSPEVDLLESFLKSVKGGPKDILKDLIDLLKKEKEYWKPPPPPPTGEEPPPPPEIPPGTPPPDEPLFPPDLPGQRQCRVARFAVPTRRTGLQIRRGSRPGLINAVEGFAMEADFVNDPADGSECQCCEYRQYVSGQVVVGDDPLPLWLPNSSDPAGGNPVKLKPFPEYTEDGLPPGKVKPGINIHYGHRGEGATDNSDRYLPDRAGGCQYRGTDQPGLYNIPSGEAFYFDLVFLGVIIDVCNGNKLRAAKVWNVRLTHP